MLPVISLLATLRTNRPGAAQQLAKHGKENLKKSKLRGRRGESGRSAGPAFEKAIEIHNLKQIWIAW